MRPSRVWAALLAAGVVYEAYAIRSGRKGDTLSELTRATFKVGTPEGREIFAAAWCGFAGWYLVHVLDDDKDRRVP